MLLFVTSRVLRAALTVLFVMSFAFVVLRLSGDPALLIMSVDAPPEAIKAFRAAWGSTGRSGSCISPISATP